MLVIGLTGSIGTGKTTASTYLASRGVPVWNADEVVHDLYRGTTALIIENAFPGVVQNGEVDRQLLVRHLISFPQAIEDLEAIIHPLVEHDRARFIEEHRKKGSQIIVLDIPLLFEKSLQDRVDLSLLIAASPVVQRSRVLARPRMSVEKFNILRARQMDQDKKRQKADMIIENSGALEDLHLALDRFLEKLKDKSGN